VICVLVTRPRDNVSHCRILSPDKTEWRLISATLCKWRRCFVADQLWLMKCIREEEDYILFKKESWQLIRISCVHESCNQKWTIHTTKMFKVCNFSKCWWRRLYHDDKNKMSWRRPLSFSRVILASSLPMQFPMAPKSINRSTDQ